MRTIKRRSRVKHHDNEEARRLTTIGPDDQAWEDNLDGSDDCAVSWVLQKDALVRVLPPYHASDSRIASVKQALFNGGAQAVRVLGRSPAPATVVHDDTTSEAHVVTPTFERPREVVEAMLASAHTDDREALTKLVLHYLDQSEAGRPVERTHARIDVGHITAIRLENWMCFPGEQTIHLEGKVYSITAEDEEDPERSNWLGKSSFLRAVVFTITGKYPTATADGWIHGAEPSGGVDVQFSNGMFISRWKQRGKSTQLEVLLDPDNEKADYTGPAAQRFIDESIIDSDLLSKTGYFEQKATDQFMAMGDAARTKTVNGWIDLEWVADAGDDCRDGLNALTTAEFDHISKIHAIEGAHPDLEEEIVDNQAYMEEVEATVRAEQESFALSQGKQAAVVEWDRRKREADRYEELTDVVEVPSCKWDSKTVEADLESATVAHTTAARKSREANTLEAGEFDGTCPLAGIDCPAHQSINDNRAANKKAATDARKQLTIATEDLRTAKQNRAQCTAATRARAGALARQEQQAAEAARLKPSADWLAANPTRPEGARDERRAEDITPAMYELSQLRLLAKSLPRELDILNSHVKALKSLQGDITTHREALAILGRNGAQRAVSEGALAQIEQGGNRALKRTGIGLELRVQWSTETKKPAEACDTCGAPFPASARVKQCKRCGAQRGRKLSYGLRIVLSNVSGGADDLAGWLFKLSASHWLRQYGQCAWSILLIDEPFGALDRAHVRRLSTHLSSLLKDEFGASQAFIVAHDSDVLESTPGRIHITSSFDPNRVPKVKSTIKVL